MAAPSGRLAGLLRELRARAGRTQQELADAAGLSLRTVSDLERGAASTPQRETVRLLADALQLTGPERARFETAARGHPLQPPTEAAAAAVRSLPRDVASFTGRRRELDQLAKAAAMARPVVAIHAIGGMAGVGKTAFAVHAAHQLADRFPGGQVFLQLHGHAPDRAPVTPADALASLLLAIGVPPARVPPELETRAALWRDRVADRPLLLVLDDAASSEQVQPLLPGTGGSLVLVTSRRHLSALDDATAISLDTLPPGEAAALLVRLAGRPGLAAGDPGVREIIELCGYLPLAIGLVARQLRHHPTWSAAARAAELASARDRLELMQIENLSVAAAFDLSYATLSADQQRLFRRIGLHPGADIDAYAAGALDEVGPPAARRGLEALYDRCLLTEPVQGRYRLHDLIREHARALADRLDPAEERQAAVSRLVRYYQRAAAVANVHISRMARPGPVVAADPAVVPALTDRDQALGWARAERASLLACLDHATAAGQLDRVIALTAGVSGLLLQDGPWADAVGRHTVAVAAARELGDRLGQASALVDLGHMRELTDDFPAARQTLRDALGLYRELGDRLGQANALNRLGAVLPHTGDYPGAVRASMSALALYRDLGDRLGQARTLNYLGGTLRLTGDYRGSSQALEQAFALYRDLGDRVGQARARYDLGTVLQRTGDHPAAAHALEQALGGYRDLGHRLGQANTLSRLGIVLRLTGDLPAAARRLSEALEMYRALGNRRGQANALNYLGTVRRLAGDLPAAARALDEALDTYRDIGDRGGEVTALNERGELHRAAGQLPRAGECHQRSLELSRAIASAWDEANALAGLGRCALADGDRAEAEALLRQALEIFQRIGAAEAPGLLAEVAAVADQGKSRGAQP